MTDYAESIVEAEKALERCYELILSKKLPEAQIQSAEAVYWSQQLVDWCEKQRLTNSLGRGK